jgi:hypothetical protein
MKPKNGKLSFVKTKRELIILSCIGILGWGYGGWLLLIINVFAILYILEICVDKISTKIQYKNNLAKIEKINSTLLFISAVAIIVKIGLSSRGILFDPISIGQGIVLIMYLLFVKDITKASRNREFKTSV